MRDLAEAMRRHVAEGGSPDALVVMTITGPPDLVTDDLRRILERYNWQVTDDDGDDTLVVLTVQPDMDDPDAPFRRTMVDDEHE